ncbi:Adaptive-response sensory-kinase SasA [Flavobacterium bizetiae]|uniref:histidine kinase n=1 Tax=Flavobacterium bizetiae TaxID=2704140 RepID=A0A6J4GQS0_9FLAO|nr:ATP-binding protein [Flavobacterium bizetiae]CAA9200476.1 Adaptive-response sensory-kinase SasA [Flavobacterium bizetiae]CAD5340579.1 Adaptive-response sensory-kinase SasA [Flavobacterium bizetiae]CAD5346749.1 Adaptive-response sensory-kinase SasA [Flavobacterium bizetiae]
MKDNNTNIESLKAEIEALKQQLYESNSIVDAIKQGDVDALVVNTNGTPQLYSLETADYTFRLLIEKFAQGALSISRNGLVLYCNDFFSKLIGIPAEKIIGSYLYEYFNSQDNFVPIIEALKYGITTHEIVFKTETYRKTFPAYISVTDLEPAVQGIGIIITDLTEKKKHEDALIQHQKDLEEKIHELNKTNDNLEEFIHVISHDLKEPLRKIVMYNGRIDGSYLSETDAKSMSVMKAAALRLNSLVDDLVSYSSHTAQEERTDVNLVDIIREVSEDLEIIMSDKKAVIKIGKLPTLKASRVQMRQLFSNLISNAIKYSKKDNFPVIEISQIDNFESEITNLSDQFIKIQIKDNGIGMEQNHLLKIFTIFQRLHAKNEYSGNGIGLAICKKIMENHSGNITVESKLNEGTIFNLYFPIL